MEVETGADEGGGGVREARGVGIWGRARAGRVPTEGVERGLDPETTLASAALGGCFLCGGESEGADGDEGVVRGGAG